MHSGGSHLSLKARMYRLVKFKFVYCEEVVCMKSLPYYLKTKLCIKTFPSQDTDILIQNGKISDTVSPFGGFLKVKADCLILPLLACYVSVLFR